MSASSMYQRLLTYLKNTKSFDRVLRQMKILEAADGKCKVELKLSEEHTNRLGGLHGGFSVTLVDVISSLALSTHKDNQLRHVSVDIHCSYLKGAKLGDEIIITANTLKTGKTLAFLEVDITNKDTGDLLVKGSHTKYIIQPK